MDTNIKIIIIKRKFIHILPFTHVTMLYYVTSLIVFIFNSMNERTIKKVRHLNESMLQIGALPHPGVGPLLIGEDQVKHHAYYQWVPFILFLQGIMFRLPHMLWKSWEGNSISPFY